MVQITKRTTARRGTDEIRLARAGLAERDERDRERRAHAPIAAGDTRHGTRRELNRVVRIFLLPSKCTTIFCRTGIVVRRLRSRSSPNLSQNFCFRSPQAARRISVSATPIIITIMYLFFKEHHYCH